jgi:hypothetical protein
MTKTQQQQQNETVIARENKHDNILYKCMEIAKLPTKWGVDKDNNICILYPHPIVAREAIRIDGIEYKPYKTYLLPEVLLERLVVLEDEIEAYVMAQAKPKAVSTGKVGRPCKHTSDEVREWVQLKESGVSFTKIAEQYNTSQGTVSNYVKKYKAEQEAM